MGVVVTALVTPLFPSSTLLVTVVDIVVSCAPDFFWALYCASLSLIDRDCSIFLIYFSKLPTKVCDIKNAS
jgi:hypothetical protein